MNKVVLAYSGGLDTSVAVAWLREQFGVDVVTLTVDVGGGSLREGVERRAISRPAPPRLRRRCARTVRDRLRVAAPPGRRALPGRVPARHGPRAAPDRAAPRRGRDSAKAPTRSRTAAPARATTRSASTWRSHALDPGLEVIAPMRVGMGLTRDEEIDYAIERNIEIPITKSVALFDRRQPVGSLDRDGRPRGSVGLAAGRRVRVDRRPRPGARPGRGHDRASRAASRVDSTASD